MIADDRHRLPDLQIPELLGGLQAHVVVVGMGMGAHRPAQPFDLRHAREPLPVHALGVGADDRVGGGHPGLPSQLDQEIERVLAAVRFVAHVGVQPHDRGHRRVRELQAHRGLGGREQPDRGVDQPGQELIIEEPGRGVVPEGGAGAGAAAVTGDGQHPPRGRFGGHQERLAVAAARHLEQGGRSGLTVVADLEDLGALGQPLGEGRARRPAGQARQRVVAARRTDDPVTDAAKPARLDVEDVAQGAGIQSDGAVEQDRAAPVEVRLEEVGDLRHQPVRQHRTVAEPDAAVGSRAGEQLFEHDGVVGSAHQTGEPDQSLARAVDLPLRTLVVGLLAEHHRHPGCIGGQAGQRHSRDQREQPNEESSTISHAFPFDGPGDRGRTQGGATAAAHYNLARPDGELLVVITSGQVSARGNGEVLSSLPRNSRFNNSKLPIVCTTVEPTARYQTQSSRKSGRRASR